MDRSEDRVQRAGSPRRARPGRGIPPWTTLVTSLPLLAFIALPILALFGRTDLQTVVASLATPEARAALQLSMQTTLVSTMLTVLLGTPLGLLLAQPGLRFGRPSIPSSSCRS